MGFPLYLYSMLAQNTFMFIPVLVNTFIFPIAFICQTLGFFFALRDITKVACEQTWGKDEINTAYLRFKFTFLEYGIVLRVVVIR